MSERIKKLAEQAGYYLYDLTETHECKTVETDDKDEWITLEKFAELIVRECVGVCSKSQFEPFYADHYDGDHVNLIIKEVTGRLGKEIEQHFGVE